MHLEMGCLCMHLGEVTEECCEEQAAVHGGRNMGTGKPRVFTERHAMTVCRSICSMHALKCQRDTENGFPWCIWRSMKPWNDGKRAEATCSEHAIALKQSRRCSDGFSRQGLWEPSCS